MLDSTATVRTAEDIHDRLSKALQAHATVEVDCAAIEEVDLSLVQLLLAARESARRAGKALVLTGPAAGPLSRALAQGGFLSGANGRAGSDEAFWLKGGDAR